MALLYDGMRYVKNIGVSPERVHDCDLRALELGLFGFAGGPSGERITPGDWFYAHHHDGGSTSTAPSPTGRSSSPA